MSIDDGQDNYPFVPLSFPFDIPEHQFHLVKKILSTTNIQFHCREFLLSILLHKTMAEALEKNVQACKVFYFDNCHFIAVYFEPLKLGGCGGKMTHNVLLGVSLDLSLAQFRFRVCYISEY